MHWSRLIVLPILFLSAVLTAAGFPSIAGHWEGKITLSQGIELGVMIDFEQENGIWKGDIDIPVQAAKDLPLTNITVNGAAAEFEIVGPPGKPTFKGSLLADGNTISGNFMQSGQTFPFTLTRGTASKPDTKAKTESEILNDIRKRIETTMPDWHTPGLAVAVIKDGKVILAEGFGVKETKTNQPVTANTLFAIGSSTKAFTATVMGIAVDEGKIKWEEPVRTYIPSFQLHDEFASDGMTAKDLLTHRSGLPRHDVVWYGSSRSRKELFDRLKYLEPTRDFRSMFQYQNLMFMAAGYLEEQVEGKSWEALVKEKILAPAGMTDTNFSIADSQKSSDFALPYDYKEEEKKPAILKEIPFRNIDAVGPAGSINSNITDMSKWVLLNLNGGAVDGKTIVSKAALDEIQGPQIVIRGGIFAELLAFPEMPYLMYGMGWFIQPYRGHRLIHHGGNIDGFSAIVSFMPDDKLGLVILTNLDGNLLVDSLMLEVYDRLLGLEPIDWNARYKLKWAQIKEAVKQSSRKEEDVLRKSGTKPSHSLQDFAGDYEESAYGRLTVEISGTILKASLHGLGSTLEHFHYDIYRATEDPLKGTKLTFLTNLRGDIDRVSVPLEAGVPDILFKRVPPASMRHPGFLQQFVGEYELMGLAVTVQLRDDHLTLTVPGQPTYTLEPYLGTEFNLKDIEGYSVKFTVVKDKVTEAVFIQPNGVFPATRKK